eukprot:Nk52_evm6s166 gene=Nk52_evmTU6s166
MSSSKNPRGGSKKAQLREQLRMGGAGVMALGGGSKKGSVANASGAAAAAATVGSSSPGNPPRVSPSVIQQANMMAAATAGGGGPLSGGSVGGDASMTRPTSHSAAGSGPGMERKLKEKKSAERGTGWGDQEVLQGGSSGRGGDDLEEWLVKMYEENGEAGVSRAVLSIIAYLKSESLKPNPFVYMSVFSAVKKRPDIFRIPAVKNEFMGLLKKASGGGGFKIKTNPFLPVLAANILCAAYRGVLEWPEEFVTAYLHDASGDRVWIDNEDARLFVDNIRTAFDIDTPVMGVTGDSKDNDAGDAGFTEEGGGGGEGEWQEVEEEEMVVGSSTVMQGTVAPQQGFIPVMPHQVGAHPEKVTGGTMDSMVVTAISPPAVMPRYSVVMKSHLRAMALKTLNDVIAKSRTDNPKSALKLLLTLSMFKEARLVLLNHLESWIYNANIARLMRDVLPGILSHCVTTDVDDITFVRKIVGLKMKKSPPKIYFDAVADLLKNNREYISIALDTLVVDEIGAYRDANNRIVPKMGAEVSSLKNPNNITVCALILHTFPVEAEHALASVFQEVCAVVDDFRPGLRLMLRKLCKVKDVQFVSLEFVKGLVKDRKSPSIEMLDLKMKERYVNMIVDIITLSCLVCMNPIQTESGSGWKDLKENSPMCKEIKYKIADIQMEAITWVQTFIPTFLNGNIKPGLFRFTIRKVLFLEQMLVTYTHGDPIIEGGDKQAMALLAFNLPIREDTLSRLLYMGITNVSVTPTEMVEVLEEVVYKAAKMIVMSYADINKSPDACLPLKVNNPELIDAFLKLSAYQHPANIPLPVGYHPPPLAISALFWRVAVPILTITSANPSTIGSVLWSSYPTFKYMIEMLVTKSYQFPPISGPREGSGALTAESFIAEELQMRRLEKDRIIEFENHLARATNGEMIIEENSLLIPQLIFFEPKGKARMMPSANVQFLKAQNEDLKLGYLLCISRSPDFVLDIMRRHDPSESVKWLGSLIENDPLVLDMLPNLCLCELLLCFQGDNLSVGDKSSKRKNQLVKLISRLRQGFYGKTDLTDWTSVAEASCQEIIDYYCEKLSSTNLNYRNMAHGALSLIFETSQRRKSGIGEDDKSKRRKLSGVLEESVKWEWLTTALPELPIFANLRPAVVKHLHKALLVESNVDYVVAYLTFIFKYGFENGKDPLPLCMEISEAILKRSELMQYCQRIESCPVIEHRNLRMKMHWQLLTKYWSIVTECTVSKDNKKRVSDVEYRVKRCVAANNVLVIQRGSKNTIAFIPKLVVECVFLLLVSYEGNEAQRDIPKLHQELLEYLCPRNRRDIFYHSMDSGQTLQSLGLVISDALKPHLLLSEHSSLCVVVIESFSPMELLSSFLKYGIVPRASSAILYHLDDLVKKKKIAELENAILETEIDVSLFLEKVTRLHTSGEANGKDFLKVLQNLMAEKRNGALTTKIEGKCDTSKGVKGRCSPVARNDLLKPCDDVSDDELQRMGQKLEVKPLDCSMFSTSLESTEQAVEGPVKSLNRLAAACKKIKCDSSKFMSNTDATFLGTIIQVFTRKTCVETIEALKIGVPRVDEVKLGTLESFLKWVLKNSPSELDRCLMNTLNILVILENCPTYSGSYRTTANVTFKELPINLLMMSESSHFTRRIDDSQGGLVYSGICGISSILVDCLRISEPETIALAMKYSPLLFADISLETRDEATAHKADILAQSIDHGSWKFLTEAFHWILATEPSVFIGHTILRCNHIQKTPGSSVLPGLTNVANVGRCLDFICSYLRHPRTWRGGIHNGLRKDVEIWRDPIALCGTEMCTLTHLICCEAILNGLKAIPENSDEELIENKARESLSPRLPLLLYFTNDSEEHSLSACLEYLAGYRNLYSDVEDRTFKKMIDYVYGEVNVQLYVIYPRILNSFFITSGEKSLGSSNVTYQMNYIIHRLMISIMEGNTSRTGNRCALVSFCKLAQMMPNTVLQYVPVFFKLESRGAQLSLSEFVTKGFLNGHTNVISILESLSPTIFKREWADLRNEIYSFFNAILPAFIKTYDIRFFQFLNKYCGFLVHFFAEDEAKAWQELSVYTPLFEQLYRQYDCLDHLSSLVELLHEEASMVQDRRDMTNSIVQQAEEAHSVVKGQSVRFLSKSQKNLPNPQVLSNFRYYSDKSQMVYEGLCSLENRFFRDSKYASEVVAYLSSDIGRNMINEDRKVCDQSIHMMLRIVQMYPSLSQSAIRYLLDCLQSRNPQIVANALRYVSDFAMLCPDYAVYLLDLIFVIGLSDRTLYERGMMFGCNTDMKGSIGKGEFRSVVSKEISLLAEKIESSWV